MLLAPSRGRRHVVFGLIVLTAGCVDRRFVVTTNVPGAQIDVDGKPLGPSPVDSQYIYAGDYTFTASAPGFETRRQRVNLRAKWYQYPPLDFVAEVLYPGRIEDVRYVHFDLAPAVVRSDEELLAQGGALRARGLSLPPPAVPDNPPAGATAGQPVAPTVPPLYPTQPPTSPAIVTPEVPATLLPPLASPRSGDTPGGLIRPPN